jgi:hypothetical protein
MEDRRKSPDRRSFNAKQEQACSNNRRRFPDRRLNKISVEWVPLEQVHDHPATGTLLAGLPGRIVKKLVHAQTTIGRGIQKHDIWASRLPEASSTVTDDNTTTGNRWMQRGMTLKAGHSPASGEVNFRIIDTVTRQRVRKDTNLC